MRRKLIVAGILAVLLAGPFYFLIQNLRERSSFNYRTIAHQKRIGMMFHVYHQQKGHFPPAYTVDANGNKLHSWRTLLLEVELPELFAEIRLSEPWNSEHNRQVESQIPYFYIPPVNYGVVKDKKYVTNHFVFVDELSAFPGAKSTSFKDVGDSSSTILILEAPGYDVHWMEPVDFDKKTFADYYEKNWSKGTKKGFHTPGLCMIDDVAQYNKGYSLTEFSEMFAIRKGQKIQGLGQ